MEEFLKAVWPHLATLLAAFFGAFFAFQFERKSKNEDEKAKNISSANRSLFVIFQQINSLALYQRDFIDPHRDSPARNIEIRPILPENDGDISFEFPSLSFLLDSKHRQLVLDLFIEQKRFEQAIKVINYRSMIHKSQVQPALMRAGAQEGQDYPLEGFKQALGPLLWAELSSATDQVIYHVDRTVESLEAAKNNLLEAYKGLYPEVTFLNFELLKKENG